MPAARWRRSRLFVVLAIVVIVGTVAIATIRRPGSLSETLLVVFVEVIALSLIAGRTVAAATAVGAALAVNWFLVPPYGSLAIAEAENWVTLGVFVVVAVGVSTLVKAVVQSEASAAAAGAREIALRDALRSDEASAADALHVLCVALELESAVLRSNQGRTLLCSGPELPPTRSPVLRVPVGTGFQVLGWGPEVLGVQPAYAQALATAVVRAWESESLVREQQRSAQLAEVDAARAALLASIGHDLRTPLSGMRLSADALAIEGLELSEHDRAELVDSLRQSAIRLDELLGAVLDTARLEHGQQVQPTATDLRVVVGDVLGEVGSKRAVAELPDEPVLAEVDAVLLGRILANVVGNALAHTPPHQQVSVRCMGAAPGSVAQVVIVDHGPGLAPTGVDRGHSRGGLGLVIVERLAALAGVEVGTSETPGGGLTVTLTVPRAA